MYRTFSHSTASKTKPDFFTLFPIPDFLSMRTLGFDISDNSIKIVELIKRNGQTRIGFYAASDIPIGTIESGQILNYTGLEKVITEMQRRHKFTFVNASLPEQKAYLYTTTVKGGIASAIRENIEFHLEENIPLTKAETVFDFEVYRSFEKNKEEYQDVTVSAISRTVSESYVALLKRSGLRPISLSIEAEAITSAVVPDGDDGTYLIVDFGKTRTGVSVVSEGITRITTTIDAGGEHMTKAISEDLKISMGDAEELKREHGILGTGEAEAASKSIEKRLATITSEIDSQLRYWHSKTDERGIRSKRVTTLILCGGGALMKGIEAYLKKNLSVNVELANVWSNALFPKNYIPEITFENSLGYAAAIGLALKSNNR